MKRRVELRRLVDQLDGQAADQPRIPCGATKGEAACTRMKGHLSPNHWDVERGVFWSEQEVADAP
jgi:hypothetical protein